MKTAQEVIWQKKASDNFISPDALVIDALDRLMKVDLSYLIVKDGDNVKGIFSERDYARKVILKGRTSKETTVGEVMTTDLPKVNIQDPIEKCMSILAEHGRRYVLVMNKEKFEGVITIHDLLREVLLHGERVFDSHITRKLLDINEHGPKIY